MDKNQAQRAKLQQMLEAFVYLHSIYPASSNLYCACPITDCRFNKLFRADSFVPQQIFLLATVFLGKMVNYMHLLPLYSLFV